MDIITNQTDKRKRFIGLRRRINECLNVMEAVGRIIKKNKIVTPVSKKDRLKVLKEKAEADLQYQITKTNWKKQVYFDTLSKLSVMKEIAKKN